MMCPRWILTPHLLFCVTSTVLAQATDGLSGSLSTLYRLSNAKSYSISPENPTGEKGKGAMAVNGVASSAARDLGREWKVNPKLPSKEELEHN